MGGLGGCLRVQLDLLNTGIMKMYGLKAEGTFVAPLSHSWHFRPGQGPMMTMMIIIQMLSTGRMFKIRKFPQPIAGTFLQDKGR